MASHVQVSSSPVDVADHGQHLGMSHLLLSIYLNDHLLGATAGVELFRRAAHGQRDTPAGPVLDRLSREVAEDREELITIMARLEIPVRHYKVAAGWLGEKVGRLKLNGHLLGRSPLSDLVELEALRLGVEGKASMWRVLLCVADDEPRLEHTEVELLLDRARRQAEELEQQRLARGCAVLT
jgi:hypothetical protein